MLRISKLAWHIGLTLCALSASFYPNFALATDTTTADKSPSKEPLGVKINAAAPNVMFVMGRDHNLFTAAYSDYTPLIENDEGDPYTYYHPEFIYEGMYSSDICYDYKKGKDDGLWIPLAQANTTTNQEQKVYTCKGVSDSNAKWLGNFLNYITSSRLDVIKMALYGGSRKLTNEAQDYYNWNNNNNEKSAILEHTKTVIDSNAWGKVFANGMYDNFPKKPSIDISEITPYSGNNAFFFGVYPANFNAEGDVAWLKVVESKNANIPGSKDSPNGKDSLWDWISQQSSDQLNFRHPGALKNTTDRQEDYALSVVACNPTVVSTYNNNCVKYSSSGVDYYQPEGIIQKYGMGTNPRMLFGLITGGWDSNRSGALLRDNISNKNDEYEKETGALIYKENAGKRYGFTGALDQFRIYKHNLTTGPQNVYDVTQTNHNYPDCSRSAENGGVKAVLKDMNSAKSTEFSTCGDWGNPIAELLYQSGNYFQNKPVEKGTAPYGSAREDSIGLGCVPQTNPYNEDNYCAKAYSFVISDETPSFDAINANVPNSSSYSSSATQIIDKLKSKFNVEGKYLVGLTSNSNATNDEQRYKAMPTVKYISNLSEVTGLAPTQAFSYGSYNVAGVAALFRGDSDSATTLSNKYKTKNGKEKTIDFNMQTFVLAMKPNVAEIKIPVNISGTTYYVRLLPLAKTPAEASANITSSSEDDASKNDKYQYQSTNQIAGFYVQYNVQEDGGKNKNSEGWFHVNFEDFEYGSDFDMDWVVGYRYKVYKSGGSAYIQVILTNENADGYAVQHAGYTITGVDYSGTYIDLAKNDYAYNHPDPNQRDPALGSLQGNLYALDNYISDAAFSTCEGKGKAEFLECIVKTKLNDPTTSNYFDNTSIDNYYTNILKLGGDNSGNACDASDSHTLSDNCVPVYYMPRYKFSQYADGKFFTLTGSPASWRLLGDEVRLNQDQNASQIESSSRIFKVSTSSSTNDVWLKSPLWFAAQAGGPKVKADKIKNTDADPKDNFAYVHNPAQFRKSLNLLIKQLLSGNHSSSSFVPATTTTTEGTAVYATSYNPTNWYGNIYKAKVAADGGYNLNSIEWEASDTFVAVDPDDRLIATYDPEKEKLIKVEVDKDLESTEETNLTKLFAPGNARKARYFIDWLLGNHDHEGTAEDLEEDSDKIVLRKRLKDDEKTPFVLGDIVNSDVAVIKVGGKIVLAVGANDGMLHLIGDDGTPLFSFIPSAVQQSIIKTSELDYGHEFFVDSTPKYFTRNGNVYLYGSLGLNYKGGYLLNITQFFESNSTSVNLDSIYKWELTENTSSFVGKFREAPVYYATATKDYLIYSSGYDAKTPGVYVVDALNSENTNTPKIVSAIELNKSLNESDESEYSEPANSHRAISPIEIYANQSSTGVEPVALFAGDTDGYLYQIKLDGEVSGKPQCWGVALEYSKDCSITGDKKSYLPKKIFYTGSSNKPITARPAVSKLNGIGYTVIFGTGSYWTPFDATKESQNTINAIYAIKRDSNEAATADVMLTENDLYKLVKQSDCDNESLDSTNTNSFCKDYWTFVDNGGTDRTKYNKGWYKPFDTHGTYNGERLYRAPLAIGQNVYFTTSIPKAAADCEAGGSSTLYVINPKTGKTKVVASMAGLSNELSVTLHNGNLVLHSTHDNPNNAASGIGEISIPATSMPNMVRNSWIRLY